MGLISADPGKENAKLGKADADLGINKVYLDANLGKDNADLGKVYADLGNLLVT